MVSRFTTSLRTGIGSVRWLGELRPAQFIRPASDWHSANNANKGTRVSKKGKIRMRRIVNVLVWAIVLFLAPAAAFAAGDIDVGCSFGGSLVAMLEDNGGAH